MFHNYKCKKIYVNITTYRNQLLLVKCQNPCRTVLFYFSIIIHFEWLNEAKKFKKAQQNSVKESQESEAPKRVCKRRKIQN